MCREGLVHFNNERHKVIGDMRIKLKINLSILCTRRVEREGQELRSGNMLRNPSEYKQLDGSVQLTAKTYDTFQFVDHPMLIVNAAGTQVREFRCTCPDYVKNAHFVSTALPWLWNFSRKSKLLADPSASLICFP